MRRCPGVFISFPDVDCDALLALERDHRRGGVRHVERHFGQLVVTVVLEVPRDIRARRQAGRERDGAGRQPLAGGLCSVDERPQKTGHLRGNHVGPVNGDPILGIAGATRKMKGDGCIRKIRLAANGDGGRLGDGERRAGQLVVVVVLEKPRHVIAGRQHVVKNQRPAGAALSRGLGAVHVGPCRRGGGAGDHVRPIDADPILGVAGAFGESDLDRFAHHVNLAADGQAHRRRGLRGDAGGEISVTIGGILQLPVRRGFRPGVEPKSVRARPLGRFVVLKQADFANVGHAGELNGPRHRGDLSGHPHPKVADRDHVVAGAQRKDVALEQKLARFFCVAIRRCRAVVGVKTQHTLLRGLERIQRGEILELNLVDDSLAAVEGELIADLVADKLNFALGTARVVVHHQAAGLQRHVAAWIHRHLRRCGALAVIEIEANLPLGDVAKRGKGGVVLELDGRQLAVVAVQNHRVPDFLGGEVHLAERGLGVFVNHHVILLADGHPSQPCGKVGAVRRGLDFPLAVNLLPKVVVTIAERRGVVQQQAGPTDAEVQELNRPSHLRGALRQIHAKTVNGDCVVFVLQ